MRAHLGKYEEGQEALLAVKAFEAWRGGFTRDRRENACGLPVEDTKGYSFTLASDGSVQKTGDPWSGHAAVTLVRDFDKRIMKVWIRMDRISANNCFIPEAEAAVFAAEVAASLMQQGATVTNCIGDSQAVHLALRSGSSAESTARVASIRRILPNAGTWYWARSRRRNRLADYFTHIPPGMWESWTETNVRPPAEETIRFVEELFHHRVTAMQAVIRELPPAAQGPSLTESIAFVKGDIAENELYLKCNAFMGQLSMGLGDNVTECFKDAFTMHTEVPRLPILINRWLLGNIRTKKKGGLKKEIRLRCVMYMKREWKNLHFRSMPKNRSRRTTEQSPDEKLRDVVADVEGGRVGRARRKLGSLGVFDIAEEEVQKRVREKYPQDEEFSIKGPIRGWTPMIMAIQFGEATHEFSSLEYARDFKLPNGKAPGLSGLTYERIKAVATKGGGVVLGRYVEELVNGNLPEEVLRFYSAKHIVPLVKKKGSSDVRPIGVGDCLRRWAAIAIGIEILGHREYWPASDVKGKLTGQYGVGVRAGAETMFRVAESYLARYPGRVTAKIDAMNGYNALKRSAIWEGVIQLGVASLERYMATFYFGASLVVDGYGLFKLIQVMGVDQGDPLGPLLFSIGIWILCRDIMEAYPGILFLFYIDDLVMLGEALKVSEALKEVRGALASGNLHLATERGKQEVFCPAEAKPEGYADLCEELGANPGTSGLTILGIPCGSEQFIRTEARKIAAKYETELTLLLPLARSHPKHAMAMYTQCAIPTFNYFLRSISPLFMGEVEADLGRWDQAFFLHSQRRPCLDEDVRGDNRRWLLAGLPARMGGFGVRDAYLVGRAAYMASWADCLASQKSLDHEVAKGMAWVWRTEEGRRSNTYRGLERSMTVLRQYAGGLADIGSSAGDTVEALAGYWEEDDVRPVQVGNRPEEPVGDPIVPGRLQKSLTAAIYKSIRDGLLENIDSQNAQMLTTMMANTGGAICNAWIKRFDHSDFMVENAFLSRRGETTMGFSADEFRAAVQIRLALTDPFINAAIQKFDVVMCTCHRKLTTGGWYHLLSCESCNYNERHDGLVRILVKFARAAGLLVRGDKQSPPLGPNLKKADFEICFGPRTFAYDVRVISALSECYRRSTVKRVHPVSFGDGEQLFWDFCTARDQGAAGHMARIEKIREYLRNWVPTEQAYEPLDKKKDPIPEERRLLNHVVIEDPSRGNVDLIPLVVQVGGAVTPEVDALIKDLVEAAAEAAPQGGALVHAAIHNELTSDISNKLMRAAARNIIRMRGLLAMGDERQCIRAKDRDPQAPLAVLPSNWIPVTTPLFKAAVSVTQQATPAPSLRPILPSKRRYMKVHVPVPQDPQEPRAPTNTGPRGTQAPPNSSSSSSSSSSNSVSLSTSLSVGPS
jgi:hypothetical protein